MQTYRQAIADRIRREARPEDKYGHQPRLYALTRQVGQGQQYDDDVVYAAAWLHDLGVFVGHRPEDPQQLSRWDHVAYALDRVPAILLETGFPEEKIAAVLEAVRTHQPNDQPATIEGIILRDADILEQLGAIGLLRMVSKVGRDTRFSTFSSVVAGLQRSVAALPQKLQLAKARELAEPRVRLMQSFLDGVEQEDQGALF